MEPIKMMMRRIAPFKQRKTNEKRKWHNQKMIAESNLQIREADPKEKKAKARKERVNHLRNLRISKLSPKVKVVSLMSKIKKIKTLMSNSPLLMMIFWQMH
jgi:hypothetical protein